jgi:hypothetical protein
MSRSTVYRQVSAKRRTSVPRSPRSGQAGLSTPFGRMLAKLAFASESLSDARPRRRR